MLNPKAKLNPSLFTPDVSEKPIRDGYGEGLLIAGDKDSHVVVLCADLTESTRSEAFAKKYPERFFECGVAEQNMAAIAAGLGISGKIPFISSYATFSPGRNYEQIRTTIAYNDSNVKIAGHHAGISVGPDGATHQATEDIAIMRVMPNMKVLVPCDAIEARKATIAAAKIWGPVYLRFAREKTPVVTTEATPFRPGKAEIFWLPKKGIEDAEVALFAAGPLMYHALVAAKEIEREARTVVVNVSTIKPLDEETILSVAKSCGAAVTIEEHQIAGGVGGAIAELLSAKAPMPLERVGLRDTYGESGPPHELLEKYGMDVKDIKEAVRRALGRRK